MHIFSGVYKNRVLKAPKGIKTRPTSGRLREALFNICQHINEGARFLDLFAGTGAMGLEALSRGAVGATFVDNSKESIRCIQSNVELLGVEKSSRVIYGDVFDQIGKLAKGGAVFDIIYADPPYDEVEETVAGGISFSEKVLQLIDAHSGILSAGGMLFLEDSPKSLPEEFHVENLVLKSSRKMGRSALQNYLKRDEA